MAQLEARVRTEKTEDVVAGEFGIAVTFTNGGDRSARLNTHQASHPALVLEVRDAKDEVVLLAPPSAPSALDLEPGAEISPGQQVTITYTGFLDLGLPPGEYRVRYFGAFPALGGSQDDPLASDWLVFSVRPAGEFPPGVRIPGLGKPAPDDWRPERKAPWAAVLGPVWIYLRRLWCWIRCLIMRWLLRRGCDQVLTQKLDEPRKETISNAPAGAEAWNGTYGWPARFLLTADEPQCRIAATIRVRLVGTITAAQQTAWATAIKAAWNDRFKVCGDCWCCCTNGAAITCDIQFVTSGEHQVVNVGTSTTNMNNWGATDTVDISHEFGHMLGALDEYFTVNGTNWGAGRQPTGAIMNNPANPPVARHYETARAAAAALLGRTLQAAADGVRCP